MRPDPTMMKKKYKYVPFAVNCFLIGLTLYGTFSLYSTVININDRLNDLEDSISDLNARTNFMELRISNCYPND